jgi:hypothetical protein
VDTDFDISIFETYQTDVITHLGQHHVPDQLISGMILIILKCSQLYTTHLGSNIDLRRVSVTKKTLKGSEDALQQASAPATFDSSSRSGSMILTSSAHPSSQRANSIVAENSGILGGTSFLGGDVKVVKREKFAKHCLECLMSLCSNEITGKIVRLLSSFLN